MIYQTNMRTAYAAGRWQQQEEVRAARPYRALTERPEPQAALQAALMPIARALGTGVTAEAGAIVAAIAERTDPARVVPADQVRALHAELVELRAGFAREKAEAAVDAAIAAGKPVKPLRDHYFARHMADAAGVDRELAALPSLTAPSGAGAPPPGAAQGGTVALNAEQLAVCRLMGIEPSNYAETLGQMESA